eukprot:GHVT01049363.1.p1 GENE.GHVT01049363.1~~GHVT01049363.1.p1  ORF type:complete len:153 (+),score=26.53 GHVT01049363.1:39-461(+)
MGPSNSQRLPAARQSAPGVDATTLRELWTMLDDMAENHPEEYDKMIMDQRNELMQGIAQKQMDRRNEMVAEMGSFVEEEEFRPNPGFVVRTLLEETEGILTTSLENAPGHTVAEYFINVCYTTRIRRPCLPNGKPAKLEV